MHRDKVRQVQRNDGKGRLNLKKRGENMPGYDKTGPSGQGPMTGGRRGYCAGGRPDSNDSLGYGQGRGGMPRGQGPGGQGRGRGRRAYQDNMQSQGAGIDGNPTPTQENNVLVQIAGALEKLVEKLGKKDLKKE